MVQFKDPARRSAQPAALATHESEDLSTFLRDHGKRLYRAIAKKTGLRDQRCDEAYSDALLALCSVWKKLDPSRPPYPYARKVATLKATTTLSRLTAMNDKAPESISEDVLDPHYSPAATIERAELLSALSTFRDSLGSTDRSLLDLRLTHDLTWEAIADLLQTSKTSVQRRYNEIIEKARANLARWN